jgi:segregation and condensation protein B
LKAACRETTNWKENPVERDQIKSILESLLFVAEGPLTVQRLADVLGQVDKKEIVGILQELQAELESQGRGFRLYEVAGGYQLRTPRENADWVRKLQQSKGARMSRATLETLAIIAYKQPITRAEIEKIRGVDVDGVVTTLLERRLVRIAGRKEVAGRPFLYGTTREFLEVFNLKDLSHLPTLKEMEELAGAQEPSPTEETPAAEASEETTPGQREEKPEA